MESHINVKAFNIFAETLIISILKGSVSSSLDGYSTPLRSTAEGLRVCVGFLFFWVMSHFPLSPVKWERGRDRLRDQESESLPEKDTEREERERIGLAALAGGYSLRCHGNRGEEEEEEGSVSVSWGRASPLVCEPTSGPGWDNTPGGDLGWKAARVKCEGLVLVLVFFTTNLST